MALDQHWLVTLGLVTSSIIAVTANLLLLLVFCRRRGLRTVSNRFVINLLLTNLLSSLLLIPLLLVDQEFTASGAENIAVNSSVTHLNVDNVVDITTQNFSITDEIFIREEETETSDTKENIFQEVVIRVNDSAAFLNNQSEVEIVEDIVVLNQNNQNLTNILCYMAQSSACLACTASILSILLIGIDQYFAVIHSLRYHTYINKCCSMFMIASSWLVSVLFGILGALTQNESNLWHFCASFSHKGKTGPKYGDTLSTVYAFSYFFLVIFAPFVAICVIYVCIYTAAHKNSERMRRSTSGNSSTNLDAYVGERVPSENGLNLKIDQGRESTATLHKVQSAPSFTSLEKQSSRPVEGESARVVRNNSFLDNLKHKISNASVFKYREETRAAKISMLVIFMVFVCYIPYGLAFILNSDGIDVEPPESFNYFALVLLVISNIISPFLFAYRNKRIQRELIKFFGLVPPKKLTSTRKYSLKRNISNLKNNNLEEICETGESQKAAEPFLEGASVPETAASCKTENAKKSILKRVCSKNWPNYKKCNFITVPDSCISAEARGSFSSASTQISSEE